MTGPLETAIDKFEGAILNAYEGRELVAALCVYGGVIAVLEERRLGGTAGGGTRTARQQLEFVIASILKDNRITADTIDRIGTVAEQYAAEGIHSLARLLRLWSVTLESLSDDEPPPSHCAFVIRTEKCPECNETGIYQFWLVVVTARRPDLRAAAVQGDLCRGPHCHFCSEPLGVLPFFYCDGEREEYLAYFLGDDDSQAEEFARWCWEEVRKIDPELLGHKTDFYLVMGMPVALYKQESVGAVTIIRSVEQFLEVVNEPVWSYTEIISNLDHHNLYFKAKSLAKSEDNEDIKLAAKHFAALFLLEQSVPVRLAYLVACLNNLSRKAEADAIAADLVKLRARLVDEEVIQRIYRPSVTGHSRRGEDTRARIIRDGLPPEWGFGSLIERVKNIAEGG